MAVDPLDLATVAEVNDWLGAPQATDAVLIQRAITSFSKDVYKRTGRRALNQVMTLSDRYSGQGGYVQQLHDYPIQSVTSVTVNGRTIPQSTDYVQPGWVIDTSGEQESVAIVGGSGARYGSGESLGGYVPIGGPVYSFSRGIMNVAITYTAGYATTPEDLQQALVEYVATIYRSKAWIGQLQQSQPNAGQTTYTQPKIEMPLESLSIINRYISRFYS